MPKDVIITPASGKLDFYGTTGGSVLANINLTDNNDLSLSTTSGNLIIGDASRDVYIGDGTNEVDIVFEQNGEIRSVAGKYITVNAGTVNATGVAVNTSSPTAVMHVYGSTPSGTVLNVEGTNGSLFSVVDNLSGTLMSVNNNAGLPVFEVFSNDSIVGGRFGQNDFVVSSSGNVGIGKVPNNSYKLDVNGTVNINNGNYSGKIYVDEYGDSLQLDASNTVNGEIQTSSPFGIFNTLYVGIAGDTLFVNSVNDRVGILTTSPTTELDVNGTITATTFSGAGTSLTGTAASLTAGSATSANQVANTLTRGSYLTGNNFNGSAATTWAVDATSANTVSKVVARDASGNFSAGTITANLTGTASNVTTNANLTGDVTSTGNATSIAAGVIVNADINASAAIADTKLATISTAGKVANSATTATNANTASAIVARDASGNFTAGTITATLSGNASSVTNGVYTTGDQSIGGVKTFTSQIINTTAGSMTTGAGQLYLNGTTSNRIDFNSNGTGNPSSFVRSIGTKITLHPSLSSSSADFAIGIAGDSPGGAGTPTKLWQSIPGNSSANSFLWYGGTTNIATLSGGGQLTLSSNAGYTTPTLTLLNDSTTDGSFRFFPMPDGAGGYMTFSSAANTTTNGQLISGSSTLTGYNSYRKQAAFQWMSTTANNTSRFEFLTANGGTTGQTMTTRMAITAEGRVGIGTNVPSTALSVIGALSLYNSISGGQVVTFDPTNYILNMVDSNASTIFNITESSTHFLADFDGDGLYFDKIDARVGIKTQAPEEELHVNGGLRFAPATSVTLSNNGDVSFERVSNTQLRIKMRGTDGVTRSTTLTLS